MSSKVKLIVTIVVLVAVIVGSKLIYDNYASTSAKLIAADGTVQEPTNLQAQSGTKVTEIDLDAYKASKEPQEQPAPPEDILAPDFAIYDQDGTLVNFASFNGKPAVLNFWASWCEPCKVEMPYFDKVYGEMGEDVNFLMVNMTDGSQETQENAMAFLEKEGYTMPVYYDLDQAGAMAYGIVSLPTTVFISADGYIAAGVQGSIDETTLRKGISLAIEHKPADI